jgi:ribose-phosphate pyrophosphokinase
MPELLSSARDWSRLCVVHSAAGAALVERLNLPRSTARVPIQVQRFPDGEARVELAGDVGGYQEVMVVHRFGQDIASETLELVFALSAVRFQRPGRVSLVLPYLPYSRSDRPCSTGAPAFCRVFVELLGALDTFVTVDLHAPQTVSLFDCPVWELSALPLLRRQVLDWALPKGVVVSTDLGGAKRAGRFSQELGWELALCAKTRTSGSLSLHLVGEVRGRTVLVVDDEIDSGATLLATARLLEARGAVAIYAVATHARFGASFLEQLEGSPIRRIAVTDSLADSQARSSFPIDRISLAPVLSEWLGIAAPAQLASTGS